MLAVVTEVLLSAFTYTVPAITTYTLLDAVQLLLANIIVILLAIVI